MGMFSDDGVSDDMLIQAARKRILDSLQKGGGDSERIVNNVYGGQGGGGGGISEGMNAMSQDPADMDYFVDILRQNYEPGEEAEMVDPQTGERVKRPLTSGGWQKRVHRFTSKRDPNDPLAKKKDQ